MTADLLLELFSEEIPARMQSAAVSSLASALQAELTKAGYAAQDDAFELFVTPRRVALWVKNLPLKQADITIERKGPRTDAPQPAIDGFLRSTGLTLDKLEKRDGVYFANIHQKGRATADVLQSSIEIILEGFVWPKSMRWGRNTIRWVRPLHSILCTFDGKDIPVQFGPVKAGHTTNGHRFLAPGAITIKNPAEYEKKLQAAFVIADAEVRRKIIREDTDSAANALGLSVKSDDALLSEVTGLVEWPVVLTGKIGKEYMDLPAEVLTTVMRSHQKYFALSQKDGSLSDHFLIVANIETKDKGKAIIAGNERVLRARFADGKFFYAQDRKKRLEEWAEGLSAVTFHAKLGTMADKIERMRSIANMIATYVPGADRQRIERAVRLCKADLTTGMVGEFAELQGIMGRYYALHQGEAPEIADAIRDHYRPQGLGDEAPRAPISICLALADKLDTLVSMFAIGEKPTGSKDPFALRRAALGIIRIILENNIRLPLKSFVSNELLDFFSDRLKVQLKDQGVRHDVIAAVAATGDDDFIRIAARAKALQAFLSSEDGVNLVAGYKRAGNIVAIEEKKDGVSYKGNELVTKVLSQQEEINLAMELMKIPATLEKHIAAEAFIEAMLTLSTLRHPIDLFFDKIMVNCEDRELRANRLRLLAKIRDDMDSVANFALIEG
jgi:glycyl-tRNA synthetase beta chain